MPFLALAREAAFLAGTLLTGGYVLLAVAGAVAALLPETLLSSAHPHLQAFLLLLHSRLPPSSPYLRLLLVAAVLAPACLRLHTHWSYHRKTRTHNCLPPAVYPHADPVFGTDLVLRMVRAIKADMLLDLWIELFASVGHTYWYNQTGAWSIMTNHCDNLKTILSTDFETWPILSLRQRATIEVSGLHGILSVNGPEWRATRNMIRPTFVRNQIADLECTDRHVERFLARIPRGGDAEDFDMGTLLAQLTLDISTDFIFDHCTNMLTTPTPRTLEFSEAFDYLVFGAISHSRIGWMARLFHRDNKYLESKATVRRFVDDLLVDALANGRAKQKQERPYVFLNEVVETGGSPDFIRDQLISMVLAGRDTTASALSSLFFTLARRPDIVAKLRAEIARLGGRKPTWEELKELKYLNNVLRESLRLYPAVISTTRTAIKDTVLPRGGGPDGSFPIFVPEGTDVRWSFPALHRSKDAFGPDADEFRPERWDDLRPQWDYIPFSAGPRICIGQQFSTTQMQYLLTRVFQTFETVRTSSSEVEPRFKLSGTLTLSKGCWISLA